MCNKTCYVEIFGTLQSRYVKSAAAQTRKTINDEVNELKSKKWKNEKDNESSLNAADNYAEEAEHRHKNSKSPVLREKQPERRMWNRSK